MKYPYTLEEYKNKAIQILKKDYPNQYKTLSAKEIEQEITKSYNGDKYKYENGIVKDVLKLENEVRSAVYNISML